MQRSMRLLLSVLWLPVLWVSDAGEGSENQPAVQELPASYTQWLEEVRAQRQAWEAHRQQARGAMEARRRWIDPWGAEQRDAMEKRAEQRREAARNFAERQRETRHQPSIWRYPYGGSLPPDHPTDSPYPGAGDSEPFPGQTDSPPPPSYPPGWNNPWYYRGY